MLTKNFNLFSLPAGLARLDGAVGFIRSTRYMDWFSAQNFCRSYGKNLVTLRQMGLGNAVPSGKSYCFDTGSDACNPVEWSVIQAKFGTDYDPWTANLTSSISCSAFYVVLADTITNVDLDTRSNHDRKALCK